MITVNVSFILIVYNNKDKFFTRMVRDILPTVLAYPDWKFQFVIIDNSFKEDDGIKEFLLQKQVSYIYKWNESNIKYGPSVNMALEYCEYEYVVYICTNHGRMYNTGWLTDLIRPLVMNRKIAMTGTLHTGGNSRAFGFPRVSGNHIQGGIFASRREILRKHPYNNIKWIHSGSDLYESFQLANAGFILKNVSTIVAVWNKTVYRPDRYKYVHDYSEL